MSDRDFFREVDEAVRQDRYKQLWDQYGIYAIGAAAAVVLAVAGHKAWTYWQDKQAQEAGAKFTQALRLEDGPEAATAREPAADLDGRNLAANCTGCHGTNRVSAGAIPSIAGMEASRMVLLMQEFRDGKRTATVMPQHAKGYTDAQIEAIAAWFAAQK